jgi:hypothetical protein
LNLDAGDIVKVMKRRVFYSYGILVRRTYMAYDPAHSTWEVMCSKGDIINMSGKNLLKLNGFNNETR